MKNSQSLPPQKPDSDALTAEMLQHSKSQAAKRARELVQLYGLTFDDVFGKYKGKNLATILAQGSIIFPSEPAS